MITKDDFLKILESGLKEVLNSMPEEMIKEDESFKDYGVDSLDMMNLLLFLEDNIETDFEDTDNNDSLTPSKLYDFISQNG